MNLHGAKKEEHFIQAYEKEFRGLKPKRVLEIGVQFGGSLKIWKDMFPEAEIVGVDIDPECKQYEEDNIKVYIGDQTDVKFMNGLGEFDIIIDDGGHKTSQQLKSFDIMIMNLSSNGIYVIEDTHTSYWKEFIDTSKTTIEILKEFIDDLHDYAVRSPRCTKKIIVDNIYRFKEVAFYQGIVFLKRCI